MPRVCCSGYMQLAVWCLLYSAACLLCLYIVCVMVQSCTTIWVGFSKGRIHELPVSPGSSPSEGSSASLKSDTGYARFCLCNYFLEHSDEHRHTDTVRHARLSVQEECTWESLEKLDNVTTFLATLSDDEKRKATGMLQKVLFGVFCVTWRATP